MHEQDSANNCETCTQMIEVEGECKIVDTNTGTRLSAQPIKVYGESSTSEDIFEKMEIEQKVWKSIENGINCKRGIHD